MAKPHPYADTPQFQQARYDRRPVNVIDPTTPREARVVERTTYVYFAQVGADGPIKIGTAKNVAKRLQMLQIGNHLELTLLRQIRGGDATEARLHQRFAEARIRGEWFEPVAGLLAFIKNPEDVLRAWDSDGNWADVVETDPEIAAISPTDG